MSFFLKDDLLTLKKKTKGKVGNKGRLLVQFCDVFWAVLKPPELEMGTAVNMVVHIAVEYFKKASPCGAVILPTDPIAV